MAKKKTDATNLDALYADIAKETGGDVLEDLDNVKYCIDTGNLAINYSCSGKFIIGGVPGGRIIEAYGPEASGKSLIGSNVMYGAQRMGAWVILLDCENASNGEFMKKVSHLNLRQVIRHAPPSLERAFRTIHNVTRKIREREKALGLPRKPIVFIFDSLTVPPCERELKENNLPMDFSVADWKKIVGRQEQPGERAKVISTEMRKLQAMVSKEDVTVYLINQTRDKIGVMYGSPETTPGGNAVKFYASLRIRTAAKKKIEHSKLEKFAGINMQVKNIKNRMFRPFVIADDVKLYFEEGIDPISGLLNCLLEGERVKMRSGGNYEVAPDYLPDGRVEYKFKTSKAENRVPVQVLLDCPKLVDAQDSSEVQAYLDAWGGGLMATESGEYSEKAVTFDQDGAPDDVVEDWTKHADSAVKQMQAQLEEPEMEFEDEEENEE
jgi:recombination protein RecA